MRQILLFLFSSLLFISCGHPDWNSHLSEEGNYLAVIEIPAGTNHKIEFNHDSHDFQVDIKDGKERIIEFMPYPGNYGFIPGTIMNPDQGGDGDALDILILAESMETGTELEFIPIGMLKLLDEGEIDNKIIAVPLDEELNILGVHSYYELQKSCLECKKMIENWFINYDDDEIIFQGWGDEKEAASQIDRWAEAQ